MKCKRCGKCCRNEPCSVPGDVIRAMRKDGFRIGRNFVRVPNYDWYVSVRLGKDPCPFIVQESSSRTSCSLGSYAAWRSYWFGKGCGETVVFSCSGVQHLVGRKEGTDVRVR